MDKIYGIDLGTSNCLVAEVIGGGRDTVIQCLPVEESSKAHSFRSVVHFSDPEHCIIGETAEHKLLEHPDQTIELIKTRIGKEKSVEIKFEESKLIREYSPQELAAFLLQHIHRMHPNKVKKAVLTVPADFDREKKAVTKQVGDLAEIEIVELIEEPSAAIMYYLYKTTTQEEVKKLKDQPKNYLVFDFGGGTLDLSLIQVSLDKNGNTSPSVIAIDGNPELGGNLIDLQFCKYIIDEVLTREYSYDPFVHQVAEEFAYYMKYLRFRKKTDLAVKKFILSLKKGLEEVKILLSEEDEVTYEFPLITYDDIEISREEFEAEILDTYFRTPVTNALENIQKKNTKRLQIDQILFVGGTSRIPYFRTLINDIFPGADQRIIMFDEYDTAIAKGAAILGAIINNQSIPPFDFNRCRSTVANSILIEHFNTDELVVPFGTQFPFPTPIEKKFAIRHSLNTFIDIEVKEQIGTSDRYRTIKKAQFYHPFYYTDETVTVLLQIDQYGIVYVSAIHDVTDEAVDFRMKPLYVLEDNVVEEKKAHIKRVSGQIGSY